MSDPITLEFHPENRSLARGWLALGVGALAVAGLFAILLVLSRTTYFQAIVPFKDFFNSALIVHVNLSVLVWLLSFSACLWVNTSRYRNTFVGWLGLALGGVGALLIAVSAFTGEGNPLLNNYVPVLQNPTFFAGLFCFLFGIGITVLLTLMRKSAMKQFSLWGAAVITLCSLLAFLWSWKQLRAPEIANLYFARDYYNILFWGGGHLLQFAYTQGMLIAWLLLSSAKVSKRLLIYLFASQLLYGLAFFVPYVSFTITSQEHLDYFTRLMRNGGGIAPLLIGGSMLMKFQEWKTAAKKQPAEFYCLLWSMILFFVGGMIGYMITAENTRVPAHYHGEIIAVTLAFAGCTFYLLPKLGFQAVTGKIPKLVPWFYGGGQLLHILGLAASGGYGALRKTPGAMESLGGKISMGFMGLGGMLSVIGGLLFVIAVFRSMRHQQA